MRRHLVAVTVASAITTLLACSTKGTAVVTCGKLQKFEDRIGTINAPHFPLGALVGLNTSTKASAPLGVIASQPTDVTTSPPVASEDDLFSSDLSIAMSADIPTTAQLQVSNEVKQRSHVAGTNVKRVTMNDVAASINANAGLKSSLKSALQTPNATAIAVYAVTYADSVKIEVTGGVDSSANVKLLKYGNYELTVTYNCSDVLNMSGAQFGAFFKYAVLRYDTASDRIAIDLGQAIDLADYNLNPALTAR